MELHPSLRFDDPIEVQVTVRDTSTTIFAYDAVSYRWGDVQDRREIRLGGNTSFSITKSLDTALRYLRRETEPVLLWADGICINQSNVDERNKQVSLMGQTFSRADHVRIFIGAAEDMDNGDVAAAMQLVQDSALLFADSQVVDRVVSDQRGSVALTKLLSRPYWQRMWVFQEIVLGRNNVIHCGRLEAPWAGIQRLDQVSGDGRQWWQMQLRQSWIMDLRRALFRLSTFCIQRNQARHLTNVLLPTRGLEATNPRDKLFALMGVSGFGRTLAVDYSRSTRDIYMEFTRNYMEQVEVQEGQLALLLTAGLCQVRAARSIGLPSWTPDFRGLQGVDIRYLSASYLGQFQACGDEAWSISFHDRHCTMKTRGVILGTVNKVLTLERDSSCRRQILTNFGLGCRAWSEEPGRTSCRDIFEMQVFYDAAMGGCIVQDSEFVRRHKQERLARLAFGFAHDVEHLVSSSQGSVRSRMLVVEFLESFVPSDLEDLVTQYDALREFDEADRLHWLREEFLSRYQEGFSNTQAAAFSTGKGHFGKGPRELKEGDQIAIVFGCRIPLVLRSTGDRRGSFRLVGPCYVSGMMSGEAFRDKKGSKEFPERDIFIR